MTEQEHVAERFKKSYPFVNIVFGTHVIHRLPEMLYTTLTDSKRVFLRGHEGEEVLEGIPTRRDGTSRAWVTVMLGCDNFCSYCIVPYVRGREKSRRPEEIVKECRQLIEAGYKEITLLGQNVNSYGKGLEEPVNFAELLRRIDAIPGDYRIRFMTSHPKDASRELFDVMAHSQHIPHYIHLPFQSGNDRVLKEMNRRYTREQYLELIRYARSVMPDISFTSDVIVGFPGETYEEFQDTLSLIREGGLHLSVHLYLLPPGGDTGRQNARPRLPRGEDPVVRGAIKGPGGGRRPAQRRHGGPDLPGAGGGAKRKVRPAFGPHGLQRGHRLPRRGGAYRPVRPSESHRRPQLDALRGAGGVNRRGICEKVGTLF